MPDGTDITGCHRLIVPLTVRQLA